MIFVNQHTNEDRNYCFEDWLAEDFDWQVFRRHIHSVFYDLEMD